MSNSLPKATYKYSRGLHRPRSFFFNWSLLVLTELLQSRTRLHRTTRHISTSVHTFFSGKMSSKANRKDDINSNGKRTPTRNNEQKKSFRPYGHDLTPTPIGDRLLWSWIAENASIIQNVKVTKGPLERADPNAEAEEGCRIYIPITPLHDVHEDEVRNIFKRSVKFRDVVDINFVSSSFVIA